MREWRWQVDCECSLSPMLTSNLPGLYVGDLNRRFESGFQRKQPLKLSRKLLTVLVV